jgi:hypothetical protein
MMPDLLLNVPQDLLDRLEGTIPEKEKNTSALALAALEEWVDWLTGDSRPMSVSELETERIYRLYDRVLKRELPSVGGLGRLLNLPMGRARYIVQSLAYRRGRFLLERQVREILRGLEQGKWSNETCTVVVDRGCQALIDRIQSDLEANSKIKSTVTGVATLDGIRYKLGKNHHSELMSELKRQLDAMTQTRGLSEETT